MERASGHMAQKLRAGASLLNSKNWSCEVWTMSTSVEFDELIRLLVEKGSDFEIPDHLLGAISLFDVSAPFMINETVLNIAFIPETAKFIRVVKDDLFVVTSEGEMILYQNFLAKLETDELEFVLTPQGVEMHAVDLFEMDVFSSDIANEFSQIATSAGSDTEETSNEVSAQFRLFENQEIGVEFQTSGPLGNSDLGIERLFRPDRFPPEAERFSNRNSRSVARRSDREGERDTANGEGRADLPERPVFLEIGLSQGESQILNPGGALDFPDGAGLQGTIFDTTSSLSRLNQIDALIEGNAPSAAFTATELAYRGGSTIRQFLGADGDSGTGDIEASAQTFAVQLQGYIFLEAGTHQFDIATDDGFRLQIAGETVSEFDGNRGTRTSSGDVEIAETGLYPIDVVYWENGGGQTLNIALNGETLSGSGLYTELPEDAVQQPNGHYTMPDPSVEVQLDVSAALTALAPEGSLLSVSLIGIPSDVSFSAGVRQEDGSITLEPGELGVLTLTMDEGQADFDVTLSATRSVDGVVVDAVSTESEIVIPQLDDSASTPVLDVTLGAPTFLSFDHSGSSDEGVGLKGEIFETSSQLSKLAHIDSLIEKNSADGSFTATEIYYTGGNTVGSFLGDDGDSLSSGADISAQTFAIKLTGYLKLDAGNHSFDVRSDDGFRLKINGEVVTQYDGNRGARSSVNTFQADRDGLYEVELVYWENSGAQVLDVELDGTLLEGGILFEALPPGYLKAADGIAEPVESLFQYPFDITSALSDLDGSETLSITVSGLPSGAALSAGSLNDDGSITLAESDLQGLVLTVPADVEDFNVQVEATATEALGGDTASATVTIPIDIPEASTVGTAESDILDFRDGAPAASMDGTFSTSDGDDVILLGDSLDNLSSLTQLDGGSGTDTVMGTSGDDVYNFADDLELRNIEIIRGGDGDDILIGGISDDNFFGDAGNDVFSGGGGNDTLSGGDGLDQMTGGIGADTFVLAGSGLDRITDFSVDEGDVLDVSSVVDVTGVDDIDAYLRVEETVDGDTAVMVNASGSGEDSDFTNVALLEGVSGLSVQDIIGSSDDQAAEVA